MDKEKVYKEIQKLELPEDKLYIKSVSNPVEVIGSFIEFESRKKNIIIETVDGLEVTIDFADIVEIRAILSDNTGDNF